MLSEDVERRLSILARNRGLTAPPSWRGCTAFWPLLEQMRSDGAVVVIKLDGQRRGDERPYTVVVSGGGLGTDFVQHDGASVEAALAAAVLDYADTAWVS